MLAARMAAIRSRKFWRVADCSASNGIASRLRIGKPLASPVGNAIVLPRGKRDQHVRHGLAVRGAGVESQIERDERRLSLTEPLDERGKIDDGPAQIPQVADDECTCLARPHLLEGVRQARAVETPAARVALADDLK